MVWEAILGFVLENPEWGWLFVIGGGLQQLFAPWETKTKSLVTRLEKRLEAVEHMQKAQMTVIRALARTDDHIETEKVDDYLVENGVHPETFIREADIGPWKDEEFSDNSAVSRVEDTHGKD